MNSFIVHDHKNRLHHKTIYFVSCMTYDVNDHKMKNSIMQLLFVQHRIVLLMISTTSNNAVKWYCKSIVPNPLPSHHSTKKYAHHTIQWSSQTCILAWEYCYPEGLKIMLQSAIKISSNQLENIFFSLFPIFKYSTICLYHYSTIVEPQKIIAPPHLRLSHWLADGQDWN